MSASFPTSESIFNRLKTDSRFLSSLALISYFDSKLNRLIDLPLNKWIPISKGGSIPWSRVYSIKYGEKDEEQVIWDREKKICLIDQIAEIAEEKAEQGQTMDNQEYYQEKTLNNEPSSSSNASSSASAVPSFSLPLRLFSWNLMSDVYEKSITDFAKRESNLIEQLLQWIPHYDIIAFQEVMPSFIPTLKQLFQSQFLVHFTALGQNEIVLMIRNSFKIVSNGSLVLNTAKEVPWIEVRVPVPQSQSNRFASFDCRLRLYGVHLTSDSSSHSTMKREFQCSAIEKFMLESHSEAVSNASSAAFSLSHLFLGDFNTDARCVPGWTLPLDLAIALNQPLITYDPHSNPLAAQLSIYHRPKRLDRFYFYSPDGSLVPQTNSLEVHSQCLLSDHFAISAAMQLQTPAAASSSVPFVWCDYMRQFFYSSLVSVLPIDFSLPFHCWRTDLANSMDSTAFGSIEWDLPALTWLSQFDEEQFEFERRIPLLERFLHECGPLDVELQRAFILELENESKQQPRQWSIVVALSEPAQTKARKFQHDLMEPLTTAIGSSSSQSQPAIDQKSLKSRSFLIPIARIPNSPSYPDSSLSIARQLLHQFQSKFVFPRVYSFDQLHVISVREEHYPCIDWVVEPQNKKSTDQAASASEWDSLSSVLRSLFPCVDVQLGGSHVFTDPIQALKQSQSTSNPHPLTSLSNFAQLSKLDSSDYDLLFLSSTPRTQFPIVYLPVLHQLGIFSHVRFVANEHIEMIKLNYGYNSLDIQYCEQAGAKAVENQNLFNLNGLSVVTASEKVLNWISSAAGNSNLSEAEGSSLSGSPINSVIARYCLYLNGLKRLMRSNGIYGKSYGYLPGLAVTILAAIVYRDVLTQSEQSVESMTFTNFVEQFCLHWTQYDYSKPINPFLVPIHSGSSSGPNGQIGKHITILCPVAPYQNVCRSMIRTTFQRILTVFEGRFRNGIAAKKGNGSPALVATPAPAPAALPADASLQSVAQVTTILQVRSERRSLIDAFERWFVTVYTRFMLHLERFNPHPTAAFIPSASLPVHRHQDGIYLYTAEFQWRGRERLQSPILDQLIEKAYKTFNQLEITVLYKD